MLKQFRPAVSSKTEFQRFGTYLSLIRAIDVISQRKITRVSWDDTFKGKSAKNSKLHSLREQNNSSFKVCMRHNMCHMSTYVLLLQTQVERRYIASAQERRRIKRRSTHGSRRTSCQVSARRSKGGLGFC